MTRPDRDGTRRERLQELQVESIDRGSVLYGAHDVQERVGNVPPHMMHRKQYRVEVLLWMDEAKAQGHLGAFGQVEVLPGFGLLPRRDRRRAVSDLVDFVPRYSLPHELGLHGRAAMHDQRVGSSRQPAMEGADAKAALDCAAQRVVDRVQRDYRRDAARVQGGKQAGQALVHAEDVRRVLDMHDVRRVARSPARVPPRRSRDGG